MQADPAIRAVAALDDDLRGGMYAFIRAARRPVTRDEAAAAVGISRKLAAFHLDKLVAAGLLRAGYEPAGKVGRAPKVYEPTDADIRITIPPRHPDILAAILIDAVLTEAPGETARDAAIRAARRHGETLGAAERARARPGRLGVKRALALAERTLAGYGFEPAREAGGCVRLRNCPFHPLAVRARDIVCALNHAFLGGYLAGLGAGNTRAVLEPRVGECCVEIRGGARHPEPQTRLNQA